MPNFDAFNGGMPGCLGEPNFAPRGGEAAGLADFAGLTRIEWAVEDLSSVGDGNPIDSWTARGPDGIVSANTTTKRPTYRSAGTNLAGPVVEWSGAQYLDAAGLSLDFTGGCTIFHVQDTNTSLASNKGIMYGTLAGASVMEVIWGTHFYFLVNRAVSTAYYSVYSPGASVAGKALISGRLDPTLTGSTWCRKDAVAKSGTKSGAPPITSNIDKLSLGQGFAGNYYVGRTVAFVIYYGRDMTPAEVAAIEIELNARYGVY